MLLPRNVAAAVLVQLERQNGHPGLEEAIPYVTQRLSTTARSVHHAKDRTSVSQARPPLSSSSSTSASRTKTETTGSRAARPTLWPRRTFAALFVLYYGSQCVTGR